MFRKIIQSTAASLALISPSLALNLKFTEYKDYTCYYKEIDLHEHIFDYKCNGIVLAIDDDTGNLIECEITRRDWAKSNKFYKNLGKGAGCFKLYSVANPSKTDISSLLYGTQITIEGGYDDIWPKRGALMLWHGKADGSYLHVCIQLPNDVRDDPDNPTKPWGGTPMYCTDAKIKVE